MPVVFMNPELVAFGSGYGYGAEAPRQKAEMDGSGGWIESLTRPANYQQKSVLSIQANPIKLADRTFPAESTAMLNGAERFLASRSRHRSD